MEAASDSIFGRVGQIVRRFQLAQSRKFGRLIPIRSATAPTACMSFYEPRDQFGFIWNIRTADDEPAHTACVAFGIDRLALAPFAAHGVEVEHWPPTARRALSQ